MTYSDYGHFFLLFNYCENTLARILVTLLRCEHHDLAATIAYGFAFEQKREKVVSLLKVHEEIGSLLPENNVRLKELVAEGGELGTMRNKLAHAAWYATEDGSLVFRRYKEKQELITTPEKVQEMFTRVWEWSNGLTQEHARLAETWASPQHNA